MILNKINQNTILRLKENGISSSEASLETEILLNFVFGITKKDFILTPNKKLPENKLKIFNQLIERRIKEKIPVQYLTNKAFFMGEEFYVDENVLIPRPETEILVEEVLRHCNGNFIKIIDIGTGSGCIACMIAKNMPDVNIFACDISEKALKVAEFNAEKLGVKEKITFIHSDIFKEINIKDKFDIIVSNPPYIPLTEKENLQSEVALHEPHQALFAEDEKGVSFYEQLAFQSKEKLNENGLLAVEIGIYQSADVVKIFKNSGFDTINIIKDYNGINRVIITKLRKNCQEFIQ